VITPPKPGQRFVIEQVVAEALPNVTDYLAAQTALSKGRIKHALNCGALRVKKSRGGFQRVRRATAAVPAGSTVSFHYDEHLLALKPGVPELLLDLRQYSVWFKPPMVLSQGSEWGDHCSLLRLVELHFQQQRQTFLVHRLDREAAGLMLVAHSGQMADKLGHLFSSRAMEKHYRVRVLGTPEPGAGSISEPLDGKPATTHYQVLESDGVTSLLSVQIETGRKHQIRRHLSAMGHAILGDTRYGEFAPGGLHLAAVRLGYQCPVQGRRLDFELGPERIHFR
jgi:tRNA pseudouridine32 synthase/23S rRNA pseudouridine746 synthase